ncbi:MAG: sensor histidine kinase N-terminal domain-containing protein [Betaproteobacteria bacterium]
MQDNTYGFSLRQRLLLRLLGPLILVLLLGAVSMFVLARHIGSVVYDRWLYDSAMTLAQQIKIKDGKAVLDLSQTAVEMFEWDSVDRVYEEVTSKKTGLVFSNAAFPRIPENLVTGKPRYYDALVSGKQARIVAVRLAGSGKDHDTFTIQVAETRHKRESLVAEILALAIPLQAFILVLATAMVWFAVTSSLRILDTIAEQLATYDPEGLAQVADVRYAPHEVRPLLDSINRLIAKLADAQSTQRRFVANAAHQLRTPLATLQVQAERALREPDREQLGVALSHVLKAVTRSRHLVHQLLTLARSDQSGEQLLEMVSVDLAELARDELEQWADAAIERGIDLGYEGPERDVLIQAEPHLLREMIGNLVDNAIRYGRQGGVVTLGLANDPVRLTVCDDGPGIPVEEQTMVVERFYRRSGAPGDGCGLGLAIAREIAIRHRAKLVISDNPGGRGTQVAVVFAGLA